MLRGVLVSMLTLTGCSGFLGGGGSTSGSGGTSGSSGPMDAGPGLSTLSSIQAMMFTPGCAMSGCHDLGTKAGNLVLAAGDSYANLVGIRAYGIAPLVQLDGGVTAKGDGGVEAILCTTPVSATGFVPFRVSVGDPTDSYLMWKLTGKDANGNAIEASSACAPMPTMANGMPGTPLSAEQLAAVQAWIQAGAKQD